MNPQLTTELEKLVEPSKPDRKAPPPPRPSAPAPQRSHWLRNVIVLCVLGAAGYFAWRYWGSSSSTTSAATAAQAAANRPVSVVAATARRGDVRVYLTGLGQVTPFETVTIHTRVDGQIMKIYFKEGQIVKAGDPLVEIDRRPYQATLDQAKGQLVRDQAYLDNAKIDLNRDTAAFKDGSVSDQQVATQKATVDQYVGIVETDQSQIESAQVNLDYCHITSPINGRIGLRLVDLGNIVNTTDTTGLAVITELQPISVVFALPEDDLGQVVGQTNGGAGLPVDAYDQDDQKQLATGVVEAVDNEVQVATATFNVKATFQNKDNALFPNQFVNAHLLASTLHNQVLVPAAAVQHGPDGGAFVYVVKPDKTVGIVNVQEGASEGDSIAVVGVKPRDIVVTDGVDRLQDGSKVTVTMSQPAGATTRPSGRGRRSTGGASTQESQ
jgi:membrane fusion protein, multidrug efflux system